MEHKKRIDELKKIFTDEFMKAHTDFKNFEDFLKDYEVFNPVSDIDRQLDGEDEKIKRTTKFKSWKEMLHVAHEKSLDDAAKFNDTKR